MFTEMIIFQVKPDMVEAFEAFVKAMAAELEAMAGCSRVSCFKRGYTFDGVEVGLPPREIAKIVKCVKYYLSLEFISIESCGQGSGLLFESYAKSFMKLLIAPFDINSGYNL